MDLFWSFCGFRVVTFWIFLNNKQDSTLEDKNWLEPCFDMFWSICWGCVEATCWSHQRRWSGITAVSQLGNFQWYPSEKPKSSVSLKVYSTVNGCRCYIAIVTAIVCYNILYTSIYIYIYICVYLQYGVDELCLNCDSWALWQWECQPLEWQPIRALSTATVFNQGDPVVLASYHEIARASGIKFYCILYRYIWQIADNDN